MSYPSRRTSAGRKRCRPSKYGRREEHIAPERLQSAAGVAGAVAQDRTRTALAMRDCNFLKPLALRPTRWPGDKADARRRPLPARGISAGMNAGSFCPSPSSVTTMAPRAAATPLRTAADWPQDCLWRTPAQPGMLRHQPRELGLGRVGRAVIDVDDLERPLAIERGGDFRDQRRDIAGLVADRHHDGHRRIGLSS